MVNGKPILVGEIDRQSDVQISKLRDELSVLLARTVDRLIDERLRSLTPPETTEKLSLQPVIPSVTDEEVRSYRATREKDLAGANLVDGGTSEPEQTAILRHYLDQKAREAANRQARQRLRQGHEIRLSLPHPQ